MKKKSKPIIVFGLVLVLLLCFAAGVSADTLDDLKDRQDELNTRIDNTEDELKDVNAQKGSTEEQLAALEDKLTVLGDEITALEAQLAEAEANLARQQEEYDTIEANLERSQQKMQTRVQSIYVNGDVSYLDVIFSATTFAEFVSNFTFYEKIVEQDETTIGDIKENKRLAKEKLDELAATKAEIETITVSKKAQEDEYSAQAEQKSALVASLEQQADSLQAVLDQFEADSAELESKIRKLSADSGIAYTGNGKFGWPLPGNTRISSSFGGRIHPITGRYSNHTGIDIPAPGGTPIRAVEDGKVIFKGYMSAYGNCVLVNHGGGYSSFYAHLSSFAVSSGQTVMRGEKIGGVGTTGWSTGNHLHFEIRVNGSPQNPLSYTSPS